MPVKRGGYRIFLYPVPALRMPPDEIRITAIGHELQVLFVCHCPCGQLVLAEIDFMAAELVIKAKAVALVTDLVETCGHGDEASGRALRRGIDILIGPGREQGVMA